MINIEKQKHHSETIRRKGFLRRMRHAWHWISYSPFIVGLLSLIWLAWRTGTKPSRATYPCQQAAAAQSSLWLAAYVFPLITAAKRKVDWKKSSVVLVTIIMLASIVWGIGKWAGSAPTLASQSQIVTLDLQGRSAFNNPASDIFTINGTTGNDGGFTTLIGLMETRGTPFYNSLAPGESQGRGGLIARDDTLIVKVNGQWDERGGTNTDLLKSLIEAITHHPDGFTGEIVVADNGQGQYGSTGSGGSLDYSRNNAEDTFQSVQKVVDSFAGTYRVSTYLWDTITTKKVDEFSHGDMEDGYVLDASTDPQTGTIVSYPKFKTRYGTYISFKNGIWDAQTRSYNSQNLKVINVPVLKSHAIYGVTACVKHYMGVGSDKLTAQAGARMHNSVGNGGMGTEMVGSRFPVLNILDAIWVNANPGRGPGTPYSAATQTKIIAASTDPVALDYWAAKNILIPTASRIGRTDTSSIDPDNTASRSFGQWLRLSMQEINDAGYAATTDENKINVYVSPINNATPSLTASPANVPFATAYPTTTTVPSPVVNTSSPSLSSSQAPGPQPGRGWINILVRVVIPLIIAGAVIAFIIYQRKNMKSH